MIGYNNTFPASYQPMMYQQQYPQTQSQAPQNQGNPMIWVQGETGAKSYLLAPNTTLPLWDSESQTIYLKSTDASGMPSMKIIDYTIRNVSKPIPEQNEKPTASYVTHEELKQFEEEIIKRIQEGFGA